MKVKIIAGLVLSSCFMAIVWISQSAIASLDTRLRFRRQDPESSLISIKKSNVVAIKTTTEIEAENTDPAWTLTIETENATETNSTEEPTTTTTAKSSRVRSRIVFKSNKLYVKRAQTFKLTCIVYGGDSNTNIFWIQETPERRYALTDPTEKQIIGSQVIFTSRITLDHPSKIGNYTCTTDNNVSAVFIMQEDDGYTQQERYISSNLCQPNEIRCANSNRGRKCIEKIWTCDGDYDCDDGSDEKQYYCDLLPRQPYCKSSEFQCSIANDTYGKPVCIRRSLQCDGHIDCPDGSDEIGCVKPTVISTPQREIKINSGNTLVIKCTVHGSPMPYINWRHQWGHICGDGFDNGRCTVEQSINVNDSSLVTGTLTVRNVHIDDRGIYSCEAHNNQGFVFAIPDTFVTVIEPDNRSINSTTCNCNGHSSNCTSDGRCQNCQHNTAGYNCEYCAKGYQRGAHHGTPYNCQLIPIISNQNNQISETPVESNYYYRLTNAYTGKNFALEVKNSNGVYVLTMAPVTNNFGQYWRFILLKKDVYSLRIRLLNDTYSLDIVDDKTYTKLHMSSTRNYNGQHWYLVPKTNGTFRLTNELTGNNKYLNVHSNNKTILMDSNAADYNEQYWNLTKITEVLHD